MQRGFSFLAGALLASLADLLADGLAPSWLVRVGTCLGGRFPRRNLRLCLGRPALLLEKVGRRLPAILLSPAAKETHGVIVDGRLADLWISKRKWALISRQLQGCFMRRRVLVLGNSHDGQHGGVLPYPHRGPELNTW